MKPQPALSEARTVNPLAVCFVVVYAGIQLLLPIRGVRADSPGGFAWRMFLSQEHSARNFEIGFRDGTTMQLPDYERAYRGGAPVWQIVNSHVDMRRWLPPHICRIEPRAAWVRLTDPEAPRIYRCP